MKKAIFCLMLMFFLSLLGCSSKDKYDDIANSSFQYSNMVGSAVQAQVGDVLSKEGTSANNIKIFLIMCSLLTTNPSIKWDEATMGKYSMLYNNIPVSSKNGAENMIFQIEQYMKNNNIIFSSNNMQSVVIYVKEGHNDYVVVSHAGVIIQVQEEIYLIEKYNPQMPYQISVFSEIEDVTPYLISRFNKAKLESVENIFIFSNDSCVFILNEYHLTDKVEDIII